MASRPLRGVFALCLVPLLGGCSLNSLTTFFTAGAVGEYERNLMILTFALMLFVFVPVVALTLFFAWRYRASNSNSVYSPKWSHSVILECFLWGGPVVIIVILGAVTWVSTHALDPYKAIDSKRQPVEIDAIAMDWKWLFVYPKYDVAAVNEMAMPVNTPVSIHLTSDTVMTAFMIPRLGSQIFAMSGMQTKLHLMPTKTGTFFGKNYQYNGPGFAHEQFKALSMNEQGFKQWIEKAQSAGQALDKARYAKLTAPSDPKSVTYFSAVQPNLFRYVIRQYHTGHPRNQLTKTGQLTETAFERH